MQPARLSKSPPTLSTIRHTASHVQNLVVGAGPAGYAVVSTLLDAGSKPTLWVDPAFESGRLSSYLDVPSNTKTKLFAKFATTPSSASPASQAAIEGFKVKHVFEEASSAVLVTVLEVSHHLQDKDPEKGCQLGEAQRMVVKLAEGVQQHHPDKVHLRQGLISSLAFADGVWHINDIGVTADKVFLATGSHPKDDQLYPGLPVIDLDDALIPSKLKGLVTQNDTVCVVGSSHSAILVLMNLLEMENGPRVVNLYRSSLKYAKFRSDGTIVLDNTGLKGTAADWAKAKIDSGDLERSGRLQRINTKEQNPSEALKTCSKLVTAVGFERNPLPDISVDGRQVTDIKHDRNTGTIFPGKLYGFGIAFPEEIIDAEFGHKEPNVGLFKFMRFTRRVLMSQ